MTYRQPVRDNDQIRFRSLAIYNWILYRAGIFRASVVHHGEYLIKSLTFPDVVCESLVDTGLKRSGFNSSRHRRTAIVLAGRVPPTWRSSRANVIFACALVSLNHMKDRVDQ